MGIDTSQKRKEVISSFFERPVHRLLDVGCGPINAHYPYQALAKFISCIDWNLAIAGDAPEHITPISANFLEHNFQGQRFDAIICADVFEHIAIEREQQFLSKCAGLLVEGGHLVISLPHAGRFAWLDPYIIKPAIQRMLSKVGLYRKTHNGTCDIRKGHKHYRDAEIASTFECFEIIEIRKFGYMYEPIGAWAISLEARGVPLPWKRWLIKKIEEENSRDFGADAFSCAIHMRRSDHPETVAVSNAPTLGIALSDQSPN